MDSHSNYLSYNILLLQVCGQYKIENSATLFQKIKHITWRVFYNFCLCYLIAGLILDIRSKAELPFSAVALNYEYAAITFCTLQKSNYYFIFDYKAARIVRRINEVFRYQTNTKLQEKNMRNCMNLCNMLIVTWLGGALFCGMLFLVIRYFSDGISQRPLFLPLGYPKTWMASPYYEIVCMTQVFLQVTLITSWVVNDVLFSSVLLHTAEQFKFLGWEFKHLVYTNLIRNGISKEEVLEFKRDLEDPLNNMSFAKENCPEIYKIIESKKFANDMTYGFNKLVEYHQTLISFCDLIEDFCSPIMLVFCIFIMVVITFVITLILTSDDTSLRFTGVVYCACASYSILFPCFIAEILTSQNEQLQQDIYDMPWYLCDEKFKTRLKFVLHRVNKEVALTIGKFSNLNLNLFLRIMNAAMSYALVISQLAENKETEK